MRFPKSLHFDRDVDIIPLIYFLSVFPSNRHDKFVLRPGHMCLLYAEYARRTKAALHLVEGRSLASKSMATRY